MVKNEFFFDSLSIFYLFILITTTMRNIGLGNNEVGDLLVKDFYVQAGRHSSDTGTLCQACPRCDYSKCI